MSNSPHLKFYLEHQISPVRSVSALDQLLEYRGSLYKGIGVLPLTIRGADVIEIAPGSGQNSLFIAVNHPKSYTLVEPNPTALRHIREEYANLQYAHTKPRVVKKMLEDFNPTKTFDIVVCENWLGSKAYERRLFKKLLSFTKTSGIIITTAVSPVGILPNLLRRGISARLTKDVHSFEQKEKILTDVYSAHLQTMAPMTRSATDWVQDNMINPAYLDICVTIPDIISDLKQQSEVVGCYPSFSQDWRWFKSLHGKNKKFNLMFENEYYKWCHGFLNYELPVSAGSVEQNKILEKSCLELISLLKKFENALAQAKGNDVPVMRMIKDKLKYILKLAEAIYPEMILKQLREGCALFTSPSLKTEEVRNCRGFSKLFGRETLYISAQHT